MYLSITAATVNILNATGDIDMVSELTLMQLASDQRKIQVHDNPLFNCSAYYTNWRKSLIEGVPWHWHDEIEFVIVADGMADAEFGDVKARLGKGDGFFGNSKVLHRINMYGCEKCQVHSFVIDPKLLAGGFGTLYNAKYIHPIISCTSFSGMPLFHDDPIQSKILAYINDAYTACTDEPEGFEYDVRYYLAKSLVEILKNYPDSFSGNNILNQNLARVRKIIDYISRNYSSEITISDLADSAGICSREVQRCFRKILKQSPVNYIQTYRIQIAGRMLMETDESVLDVGIACGFPNPSHFCKIFREHTSLSPKKFREACRNL